MSQSENGKHTRAPYPESQLTTDRKLLERPAPVWNMCILRSLSRFCKQHTGASIYPAVTPSEASQGSRSCEDACRFLCFLCHGICGGSRKPPGVHTPLHPSHRLGDDSAW